MRKKISLYTLYTLIACGISYYLIIQYGYDTQNIVERIYTYTWYIIYAAASIIIGATIRQENTTRSKIIIRFLSVVHIVSLSKIIIHDQYSAQIHMFVISALCIVLLYGVLWIPKARIRNILTIPVLILSLTVIMLATSPFHEDISGRDDWHNQQKTKLYIYVNEPMLIIQEAQANVSIYNNNNKLYPIQTISITQSNIQTNIDLATNTSIQFTSSIPLSNSMLFVQSPQGDIYDIHSQSASTVRISSSGLLVETTGMAYSGLISLALQQYKNQLGEQYSLQKASYVENKIKNKIRNNMYTQYIGGKIISYLGNKIEYMRKYQTNFENRQNMRLEAGLPTSKNVSGTNISMKDIPFIRNFFQNFTNPQ